MLRAAKEALTDGSDKHLEIVKEITEDHLQAAKAVIKDPETLQQTQQQIEKDCRKLRSFLQAAEVHLVVWVCNLWNILNMAFKDH